MMQRRGETPTRIIMFLTAMIAILIGVMWVVKHNYPMHRELGRIDQELVRLQLEFGAACNNDFYEARINPDVGYGILVIHDDEVCISSSPCNRFTYTKTFCGFLPSITRCRNLICPTFIDQTINLKDITYMSIHKNESFEVTVA